MRGKDCSDSIVSGDFTTSDANAGIVDGVETTRDGMVNDDDGDDDGDEDDDDDGDAKTLCLCACGRGGDAP